MITAALLAANLIAGARLVQLLLRRRSHRPMAIATARVRVIRPRTRHSVLCPESLP